MPTQIEDGAHIYGKLVGFMRGCPSGLCVGSFVHEMGFSSFKNSHSFWSSGKTRQLGRQILTLDVALDRLSFGYLAGGGPPFPSLRQLSLRITSDNAAIQYRIIRSMLSWLQLELVWIFAYLEWGTLQVARGKTNGLNPAFLMLMLIAIFGTVAYYLIKGYQSK